MPARPANAQAVCRDLGDGLLLRRASSADVDALAEFNGEVHREVWMTGPDVRAGVWTRDLMGGRHPWMTPRDFTLVEDTRAGKIVSSLCLIPQTWTYAGIPFGVGRPELVGTLPEYRRRGLVRIQFEIIHAWSAAEGHLVQAITGIPNYYRQFGYEMAVDLGGGSSGPRSLMPRLPEGEPEPCRVRPASEADLPLVQRLMAQAQERSLLAAVRDADHWRYEIAGRSAENANRMALRILETAQGMPLGLAVHPAAVSHGMINAAVAEVLPGASWLAVAPSLLRYLAADGDTLVALGDPPCDWVGLSLIAGHPLYEVTHAWLPRGRAPYAWYLRVPDIAAFLRRIRPVLEDRLAASAAAGHTGGLKLSFYRHGLRLVFEEGRLTGIEPWQPEPLDAGDAAFTGQTFLQLLFGHRDLDELHHIFPDCWVDGPAARVLLHALFPKQPSSVWPVD